jgi:UDP-N-acetylmuramoyl-L-alanyl-D-glutamate--2,6-diaminopimelate ligase
MDGERTAQSRPSDRGGEGCPNQPSLPLADIAPGATGRITGLTLSSATVRPGDLYVALPGTRTHGAHFAAAAVAAGAVAVLTDEVGADVAASLGVPVLAVGDPRATMAELAARLCGRPGDHLRLLAVTGTNGKTTTVFCLQALLEGLGVDVATIGTMGFRRAGHQLAWPSTTITTPEAPDIQAALARLVADGCQAVGLEVSSHALALRRIDTLQFAAAGFTNLGADHLDFHHDQAAYFEAKARLFEPDRVRVAVVHVDDPAGRTLAERLAARGQGLMTLGRGDDPGLGQAHCQILRETIDAAGVTTVELSTGPRQETFRLGLPGHHNSTDAALAICLVRAAGYDPGPALARLAEVRVPGRLERVDLPEGAPRVYVDFAHTPEAIASTLAALQGSRVIAVLGGGGDRDASKRGPMGAAAAGGADVVIVTDDNPRSEDPASIRRAIEAGAEAARAEAPAVSRIGRGLILDGGDRRSAIRLALSHAGPGDVIAVLGKGHETTQELSGHRTTFEDSAVVAEEWRSLVTQTPAEGKE